jgi:predicted short-subunit dehydrogenase-like oxidoreductase (DUF2520 family)
MRLHRRVTKLQHSGSCIASDILPGMSGRAKKPSIAIVGAGNLANALARSLHAAGYRIDEVISQPRSVSINRARKLAANVDALAVSVSEAQLRAEIVWFCVPDAAIEGEALSLGRTSLSRAIGWKDKVFFHSSGALTSDELEVLRHRGASVASVHPLMTFVRGSRPSLAGVPFAVEGDRKAVSAARRIIVDLNGKAFSIRKPQKRAYHAWGMFASPLFTALLALSERVAQSAGISPSESRKKMLPILRQTLSNYERMGAPASFSGPIARGDIETVRKHLNALKQIAGAREVYLALARVALRELPTKNLAALKRILADGINRER